jgi:hypothetical protein
MVQHLSSYSPHSTLLTSAPVYQALTIDAGAQLVGMAVIPEQQEPDAVGSHILLATSQAWPCHCNLRRKYKHQQSMTVDR